MNKLLASIIFFGVFFIVAFGGFASANVSPWTVAKVTSASANVVSLDMAVDSADVVHRAYERDGNVYYSSSLDNVEHLIGAGTGPSIAVGPDHNPQVAYLNGGFWQYATSTSNGASWSITSDTTANAGYVDIDVDSNNKAHVAFSANPDGDSYAELYYTNNIGNTFVNNMAMFADGWYDSGSGNYFANPTIKVDANGKYHIFYQGRNWGGRASWSEEGIAITTNAAVGGGSNGGYGWGSGPIPQKNSITVDQYGHEIVVYTYGANIYLGVIAAGSWHQVVIGAGSAPSIVSHGPDVAIAYADGSGNVNYVPITVPSDYPTTDITVGSAVLVSDGSNPVVGLGSAFVDFMKSDGQYTQAYEGIDTPPVPVAPHVVDVTSGNADGLYRKGQEITIAVKFSVPVTVNGYAFINCGRQWDGDVPHLLLETGAVDRLADYQSGSGTDTLLFKYVVQENDVNPDLDYVNSASLLNVRDACGIDPNAKLIVVGDTPVDLTLPAPGQPGSLGANKNLDINALKFAKAIDVHGYSDDKTYGVDDSLFIAVTFDEPVTVEGYNTIVSCGEACRQHATLFPQLFLNTGAVDGPEPFAEYYTGSGTDTLVFKYVVKEGDQTCDLDYATVNSLVHNFQDGTATILDAFRNPATLTLAVPGAEHSLGYNSNFALGSVEICHPSVLTCTDPDAGENATFVQGTTTEFVNGEQSSQFVDSCSDSSTLVENMCTAQGTRASASVSCEYGCNAGACIVGGHGDGADDGGDGGDPVSNVPEFGVAAAALVLIGALVFIAKRR